MTASEALAALARTLVEAPRPRRRPPLRCPRGHYRSRSGGPCDGCIAAERRREDGEAWA